MSEIRKYALVDEHDTEGDYEYGSLREARKDAGKYGKAVIARIYVRDEDGDLIFNDSELIWTPDGGDVWPPAT